MVIMKLPASRSCFLHVEPLPLAIIVAVLASDPFGSYHGIFFRLIVFTCRVIFFSILILCVLLFNFISRFCTYR